MIEPGPPSFYEELLAEAVGPHVLDLNGTELVITHPTADGVCDLDDTVSAIEQLAALTDEDTTGRILDAFADRPVSDLLEVVDGIREHFAVLVPPPGGFLRVVETLDLYGEAIERDLIDLDLNLYDWFRDHLNTPWAKLFRLLERPPEGGWYVEALQSDLDLAERRAELEKQGKVPPRSKRPSLVGWTRDRDMMQSMLETLRRIETGIYAASPKIKGRGPKPPKNMLRPRTADDRVREYQLYRDHDDIASQMLGSRYRPLLDPTP